MSTETIRLIRDVLGEGGMDYGGGGRGRLFRHVYVSLHCQCHHQNDSCIKMGSNESHFNVSLIVMDKVTRQCPQTTTFDNDRKGELKWIRTEVLVLTTI